MALSYGFCLGELSSLYDSAQFSNAFHAVFGDGVTRAGSRLEAAISGFSITVGTGYAMKAGRWLENDEPLALTIKAAGNHKDRFDALAVRVDKEERKVNLELMADVDPDNPPDALILYLIRVPRGASTLTPENVTDLRADPELCGEIPPLSQLSADVLYVYNFLRSGIDAEVDRVVALGGAAVEKADKGIAELDAAIQKVGAGPEVGELRTARLPPEPAADWLLCDGGAVPAEYPALSALLGGTLPTITMADDRLQTYIYGGAPD